MARLTVQALTQEECASLHERSLKLLANTGIRVDSQRARAILKQAGASANENNQRVYFPRSLVEEALRLAPKHFHLGGRRPGWRLEMNTGQCTLLADGGAFLVVDSQSGERRPGSQADWLKATCLIDAIDEVGVYWWMVQDQRPFENMGEVAQYWRQVFTHFSKHVQDSTDNPAQTRWMLEVLQVIFGDRKRVKALNPLSFLLCPFSPLAIEAAFTDAYLETLGWQIPVAVMPMPLMGSTAPGRLAATSLLGNCEALAMLCLVQAAAPGTPFIYAPVNSVMEPRTGRFTGGAVEHALLGLAVTEMGRYYHLPVEASTGSTDAHLPDVQAAYERSINWSLPALSLPDILVGPGLLDGSTVLSFEQLLIDVEVFKRYRRLAQGIATTPDCWLDDEIAQVSAGGNFLARRSTRDALRAGEWYIGSLGEHDSYERWAKAGKPRFLDKVQAEIQRLLENHIPLPLDEAVERELRSIEERARNEEVN